MNKPTLEKTCLCTLGRADIEGSKSDVAQDAWPPQASYPFGNYCDTSADLFQNEEGSLRQAFTVKVQISELKRAFTITLVT